ncbi:autoinducer binding domain-containing protein [Actibacterium sp. MT2.3-13A]|uniref:autoinducer binding domain-containing protein n=1 Tax=Actibacterium sp. MT2.3-13A TaxID=2828332 RepID=UPI001BAB614F|nr:autoinducer binding domain-containing protein [Actibacterium sp. MT2.3-13A]
MFSSLSLDGTLGRIGELCPSGYAIALHIRFTTPRYLFQAYDSAWVEYYSQNALVLHDPLVRWALTHEGARRWEDLEHEDSMGVIAAARRFGFAHAIVISHVLDGSRSLGGFTRPDRPHRDAEIAELTRLLARLAEMTADPGALPEAERAALHALSVVQTHS